MLSQCCERPTMRSAAGEKRLSVEPCEASGSTHPLVAARYHPRVVSCLFTQGSQRSSNSCRQHFLTSFEHHQAHRLLLLPIKSWVTSQQEEALLPSGPRRGPRLLVHKMDLSPHFLSVCRAKLSRVLDGAQVCTTCVSAKHSNSLR